MKNDQKPPEERKDLKSFAEKYSVTTESILHAEQTLSVRAKQIDDQITKAAYIKNQGRPFIFLDDSESEIQSVQALIDDDGMMGRTFKIPRGRNLPFEKYGMFGELALKKFIRFPLEVAKNPEHKVWNIFIGEVISDISSSVPAGACKESAHFVQHVSANIPQ